MRKFRVFLDKKVPGVKPAEEILEFEDDIKDDHIEEICSDCLDFMISNEIDSGWSELT